MKNKILILLWIVGLIPSLFYSQVSPKRETVKYENKSQNVELYNLYYISKHLGSGNLDQKQGAEVYTSLITQIPLQKLEKSENAIIGRLINSYQKSLDAYKNIISDYLSNGNFLKLDSIKDNISLDNLDLANLQNDYNNLRSKKENLSKAKEELNTVNKLMELLEEFQSEKTHKITNLPTKLNSNELAEFLNVKQNLADKILVADSSTIVQNFTTAGLKTKQDTLRGIIDEYNADQINYIKKIDVELAKLKTDDLKVDEYNQKQVYALVDEPATDQQITVNSIVQTSQKDLSYSGLSLPSESQMIEAMAIFLAKRAKQEAAIWFMDEIRNRMNNPLVYDAFPETIKLIDHLKDYQTANFSTSWRYAISSDFVKMPKNIMSSEWVKKVIIKDPDVASNLETAVSFGADLNRLMAERYNYKDIIRHFYINPYPATQSQTPEKSINNILNKSITSLYIITNELFVIDELKDEKKQFRLISYEELNGLSEQQWNVLIELMRLKYNDRIFDNDPTNNIWEKLKKDKSTASRWMGNILISLAQFDKINKEQQKLREQNKLENTDQSLYSVWKILDHVVTNLK